MKLASAYNVFCCFDDSFFVPTTLAGAFLSGIVGIELVKANVPDDVRERRVGWEGQAGRVEILTDASAKTKEIWKAEEELGRHDVVVKKVLMHGNPGR